MAHEAFASPPRRLRASSRGRTRRPSAAGLSVGALFALVGGGAVSLLATACAANETEGNDEICVRALDKLENECEGADVTITGGDGSVNCSGQVRCVLTCVDEATCEDIQTPAGTDYESCTEACE